jgi:hypothetical protein
MTKDEALDLALEALEYFSDTSPTMAGKAHAEDAITAIKQARALDKKAENARELGLDYEPVLKDNSNYRLDPPFAEPVGCEGAIVNGRVYADRLEHDYKFECEAGPLHLCNDWVEFRRCFEWLAEHATQPAQPAPVQEPVAVIGSDFQLLYCREDWAKGLKIGDTLCLCSSPAAQRQWVGLTDERIDKAAMKLAECMDYPWAQMPEQGKQSMRIHAKAVIEAAAPAAQRPFVGLTDDEIVNMLPDDDTPMSLGEAFFKFAELVEAKLKEKNT